jgi:hypothetical protein
LVEQVVDLLEDFSLPCWGVFGPGDSQLIARGRQFFGDLGWDESRLSSHFLTPVTSVSGCQQLATFAGGVCPLLARHNRPTSLLSHPHSNCTTGNSGTDCRETQATGSGKGDGRRCRSPALCRPCSGPATGRTDNTPTLFRRHPCINPPFALLHVSVEVPLAASTESDRMVLVAS